MDRLEAHPKFDPAMKITGIDEEKEKNNTKKVEPPSADRASSAKGSASKPAGRGEEEEEDLGFSMFAQAEAAAPVEKPKGKKHGRAGTGAQVICPRATIGLQFFYQLTL